MVNTVLTKKDVLLQDSFKLPENVIKWQIDESVENSKVDGQNILARVVGPFFLVNGTSLNNRFYSKGLWEKCLSKVSERLSKGGLFGTVGHDQPIDEAALMNGKISHTVTKLWIDEENKIGMGEILVLGTESGKQLNTCLRAGMPIPVSSRAYGQITGKGKENEDIIDEDSFFLETFDFVLNPGVVSAYPKVVENLEVQEDQKMDKELLEKLSTEKVELQTKLTEVLQSNSELQAQLKASNEKLVTFTKALKFYNESVGTYKEVKALNEGLRKFLQLPLLKEFADKMGLLKTYQLNVAQITNKLLGLTESYVKHGTPEQITAVKAALAKHEECGSVEDTRAMMEVFAAYAKHGSPSQVEAQIEKAKLIKSALHTAKVKSAAKKISNALDVNVDVAFEMLKVMPAEKVIENLKKIKESNDLSQRYRVDESSKGKAPVKKSSLTRAESIFERLHLTESPAASQNSGSMAGILEALKSSRK